MKVLASSPGIGRYWVEVWQLKSAGHGGVYIPVILRWAGLYKVCPIRF